MLMISCAAMVFFCAWTHQACSAPAPIPSVPGGYYEASFTLTLDAPSNGKVYYTTDGSKPTENSTLYTGGIPITDRSGEPNIYTSVRNVVADWKTHTPNARPVEKGTVVRAVFINDWGLSSEVLTQTYFVGLSAPERGCTLSLIFDYDDLFGEDGLYVTGKEYDAWYLSGNDAMPAPTPNFEKKTEVAAIAELMDASRDIMNQTVGLRLQGATARGEVKKRFTLTAREEYAGKEIFDTMLYDGITTHSVMIKSYLPDAIASELVADRSIAVQKSVPVRVFLNGELWYDSYMLERYDAQYFRQHYQVKNYVLVKNGKLDENTFSDSEAAYYGEFMYWADNTDFSDPAQWEQFQKEVDVQSYIDYIAANYFFCNIDFSDEHNYVLWRSTSLGSTEVEDMRWRWCLYDIDALEWIDNDPKRGNPAEINIFSNDLTFQVNDTVLFRSLRRSPDFCRRFVISFMDMLNNNFSPEKVGSVLEKYGHTLDWQGGVFRERPRYAVRHLAEEFNLTGALETVTVMTADSSMGSVQVNTSVIDLSSGIWTGQYYTDYPITLTAIPADGYEFSGWKGDVSGKEPSITVSTEGGITLEPVFVKSE